MNRDPSETDRRLAATALAKERAGEIPTKRESEALRRVKAYAEEKQRRELLGAVPKKLIVEATGRQHKVINELSARWGMPLAGRTVDVLAFVAWALQWFVDNRRRIETIDETPGGTSPNLERQRQEQAEILRLRRLELEGRLSPRETVRETLARWAAILRSAAVELERKHGDDARAILDEALDDAERELAALTSDNDA